MSTLASRESIKNLAVRLRYLLVHAPDHMKAAVLNRIEKLLPIMKQTLIEINKREEQQGKEEAAQAPIQTQTPPQQPQTGVQTQVPEIARNLWALARGNPDIFIAYARSYPDPTINAIASNPAQLNAIMHQINNTQSIPPQGNADGILQAPLQSSNVYGFRYDPLTKRLTVRFQGGSVYKYEGVPKQIFDMFSVGDGVARTKGSNRWGRWWIGKNPSLGAALHDLIKLGGFPYTKVR